MSIFNKKWISCLFLAVVTVESSSHKIQAMDWGLEEWTKKWTPASLLPCGLAASYVSRHFLYEPAKKICDSIREYAPQSWKPWITPETMGGMAFLGGSISAVINTYLSASVPLYCPAVMGFGGGLILRAWYEQQWEQVMQREHIRQREREERIRHKEEQSRKAQEHIRQQERIRHKEEQSRKAQEQIRQEEEQLTQLREQTKQEVKDWIAQEEQEQDERIRQMNEQIRQLWERARQQWEQEQEPIRQQQLLQAMEEKSEGSTTDEE